MSYIRKIKTKDGIKYAEVEGVRKGDKFVQKHLRYIGKMPKKLFLMKGKKDYRVLRQIEIIRELEAGKNKSDLAIIYEVSVKTIENIKKRYSKNGIQGLIHARSGVEIVKVSTPEQAAIITDVVQHPNKSAKEIKDTTATKSSISMIKKLILPITNHLKLKKKILLETK